MSKATKAIKKASKATKKATNKRIVEDRTVTLAGLKAEQGRRKNNKAKDKGEKARSASWLYRSLGSDEIAALAAGESVVKEFKNRTVTVTAVASR